MNVEAAQGVVGERPGVGRGATDGFVGCADVAIANEPAHRGVDVEFIGSVAGAVVVSTSATTSSASTTTSAAAGAVGFGRGGGGRGLDGGGGQEVAGEAGLEPRGVEGGVALPIAEHARQGHGGAGGGASAEAELGGALVDRADLAGPVHAGAVIGFEDAAVLQQAQPHEGLAALMSGGIHQGGGQAFGIGAGIVPGEVIGAAVVVGEAGGGGVGGAAFAPGQQGRAREQGGQPGPPAAARRWRGASHRSVDQLPPSARIWQDGSGARRGGRGTIRIDPRGRK